MGPLSDSVLVLESLSRAFMEGDPPIVWQLTLVVIAALSLGAVARLAEPGGHWGRTLRSRLLFGVPWGTALTLGFLLFVYLYVQGAYSGDIFDPRSPVTYAFIATSYEYPLGIVTGAFSHQGFGHFLSNAIGLAVFGTIGEYAIGHFPNERGAQTYTSWRTNPYVRPLGVFAVLVVGGVLTAVFTPGPIIGYSGVIYALAGFALVLRPLTTTASLLVTQLLNNLYNTFTSPVRVFQPRFGPDGVTDVWFANISVQGHMLGFLLGILGSLVVLRWCDLDRPSPSRLYAGTVLFGLLQGLWLLYLPADNGRFVLYRAAGASFVILLSVSVVVAVRDVSKPALPWPGRFSERIRTEMPSRSAVTSMAFVVLVLAFSVVGVGLNATSFEGTELPNDPVEVDGYQVGYTENVTNQLYAVDVPLIDVPAIEDQTNVEASGVIVLNDRRHVWDVHTTTNKLASSGVARVIVGGVGWREKVWVTRTAWSVVGGGQTYRVQLYPPEGEPRLAYTSAAATADAVVGNRSIAIQASGTSFDIEVARGNTTLSVVSMPSKGSSVTTAGLHFEREGKNLYAEYEGTRVRVAKKKVPRALRN